MIRNNAIKHGFFLLYALGGYLVGLAAIVYLVGFLAAIGVPKSIIDGGAAPAPIAIAIDVGLILAFGFVHSATARTAFKRWWTTIIPAPVERATYLYMTGATTALLVWLWRPLPATIWSFESATAQGVIYALYAAVWLMMFLATFHFGHFSFMGITQVIRKITGETHGAEGLSTRYLYAVMRHPISLGWMLAPWLTPHLTVGHAVFAGATTLYILIATPFEEADLTEALGDAYRDYKKRVPTFVPFTRSSRRAKT